MMLLRSALCVFAVAALAGGSAAHASTWFGAPNAGGAWTLTGSLHAVHVQPVAVTLTGGKVLLAGGLDHRNQPVASAEIFDPQTGRWSHAKPMHEARWAGTMTLLPGGKVLAAGGALSPRCELYDPATGSWSFTGSMATLLFTHTATLLANGKVLVAGGYSNVASSPTTSVEIYDPGSGKWTQAQSMAVARENHAAALLRNGDVLVTGGDNDTFSGTDGSAELYNPSAGTWTIVGRMLTSRGLHTETVLADGSVIVSGGAYGFFSGVNPTAMTDRYDPAARVFLPTGDMKIAGGATPTLDGREVHTATLLHDGRVLAAGGGGYVSDVNQLVILATAELYDPDTGAWTLAAPMHAGRWQHAAAELPDGRVLVAGGVDGSFAPTLTAEIFTAPAGRAFAASVVDDPFGLREAVGSNTGRPPYRSAKADRFIRLRQLAETGRSTFQRPFSAYARPKGKWQLTGSMHFARSAVPMTLLPNGKVLIEGGDTAFSGGVTAELYDPATGKWSITGSMHVPRFYHSAILLRNGRVLVVGGTDGPDAWASAEVYDPATGRFTMVNRMNSTRYHFALVGLANGKILAPGGITWNGIPRDSADLLDQSSGAWRSVPSMNVARVDYLAAPLRNGKALVADGIGENNTGLQSSELYDPATNSWSFTGSTVAGPVNGLLLANGQFLAIDEPAATGSELYDPSAGQWKSTLGVMDMVDEADTITLLADGRAIVAGGCNINVCPTSEVELYHAASQLWTVDAHMNVARYVHAAVRLRDGRVLVAGGLDQQFHNIATAEVYTP